MHFVILFKSLSRLTEADWTAFALSVVFPICLAVAGGILAALALPKDEVNAKRKKWFWCGGFATAGLTSLVLGLGQQKMAVDQRESDQRDAKAKLTDSEKREEATQNKLDLLTTFIQTRPLGLTEADRSWILSFVHSSTPNFRHSEPAAASSLSELQERAAMLSAAVQRGAASAVGSYKNATEQAKREKYDAAIKRGETEQQARAVVIVTPGAYNAEEDQSERIAIMAWSREAPDIKRLLSDIDASEATKTRGYRYMGQLTTIEDGVTSACLPGMPHTTTCTAALASLANILK